MRSISGALFKLAWIASISYLLATGGVACASDLAVSAYQNALLLPIGNVSSTSPEVLSLTLGSRFGPSRPVVLLQQQPD